MKKTIKVYYYVSCSEQHFDFIKVGGRKYLDVDGHIEVDTKLYKAIDSIKMLLENNDKLLEKWLSLYKESLERPQGNYEKNQ